MITVCGEALIDLVDEGGGRFLAHAGGSPCNVAVGLARLAVPASLLGRLGGDAFGRLLRAHLVDNGVSERDVVAAAENTTLAVVSLDPAGRATYGFYVDGTADWQWRAGDLPDPLADDVVALHTGSLASWLPPGRDAIEVMVRRERARGRVTLSYDPNVRPLLMGSPGEYRPLIERMVGLVDLVKVSEEDLAWLYPGRAPLAVALDWSVAGPGLVVLTRGGDGVTALTAAGQRVDRPAPQVEVVDTVGAGDAFTSGLLSALSDASLLGPESRRTLSNLPEPQLAQLLDFAARVAAITCTRAGADPPTRADLTR